MNLVFLASKGIRESFFFFLSYSKPCGKLALGQNCIKIITTTWPYLCTVSDRFFKNMPAILVQSLDTVFINPVIYQSMVRVAYTSSELLYQISANLACDRLPIVL